VRLIASAFLGLLFVVGFSAYLVGAALVAHISNTDSVVGAAREGDAHGLVVDVIEASLKDEVASAPPEFRQAIEVSMRPVIAEVMPAEWFYETMTVAYSGFADVIAGATTDQTVRLQDRIAELRKRLYLLGDRALAKCRELAGAAACRSEVGADAIVGDFREGVDNVLRAIPAETSVPMLIDDLGHKFLPPRLAESQVIRDGARTLRWVRWGLLGLLSGVMVLLIVINRPPWSRAIGAVGLSLVVAATLSLGVFAVSSDRVEAELEGELSRGVARANTDDPVLLAAAEGSERVLRAQVRRALGPRTGVIVAWLVVGVALAGAATVLGRSQGRRR